MYDNDIDFTYGDKTDVYLSCGATLNGEMFVLGGYFHDRQVNIKNLGKFGHLFVKMITELNKNIPS